MAGRARHIAIIKGERLATAMREQQLELTHKEACLLLHLTPDHRNYHYMHTLHQNGRVHIAKWKKSHSHYVPVFAWGNAPDTPKPTELPTRSEHCRRTRQRRREILGVELYRAIERCRRSNATQLVIDGKTVWRRGVRYTDLNHQ